MKMTTKPKKAPEEFANPIKVMTFNDEEECKEINTCEPVEFYKERMEYLESLVRKYKFDYLTGLMGKRDFTDKIDTLFEEYKFANEKFYFVLVDIDDLHNVNRNEGYHAGDMVIKNISMKLEGMFQFHQLYRVSGDEFAILIRCYTTDEADIKGKLDTIENVTYIITEPKGFTHPKHMFKVADKKLSLKKTSKKRI